MTCPYKHGLFCCHTTMSEIEWINVASKSLGYCGQLLQQIKDLKETLQKTQEEVTLLDSRQW